MDNDYVSILLDIKEQIGAMGAQLHEAARTRERLEDGVRGLYGKIEAVDRRTGVIETQHTDIIKPLVQDVARLKLLTGKFTAVWGAGFAVIIWALSYFSNEIHSLLFPPHHP
jgi:hypothetical protein